MPKVQNRQQHRKAFDRDDFACTLNNGLAAKVNALLVPILYTDAGRTKDRTPKPGQIEHFWKHKEIMFDALDEGFIEMRHDHVTEAKAHKIADRLRKTIKAGIAEHRKSETAAIAAAIRELELATDNAEYLKNEPAPVAEALRERKKAVAEREQEHVELRRLAIQQHPELATQPFTMIGSNAWSVGEKQHPRPVITVEGGELSNIATLGEKALIDAREEIYQRAGKLVRSIVSEVDAAHGRLTKVAELKPLDREYIRDVLGIVASWQRFDARSGKMVSINPPAEIGNTILARYGHWSFPVLAGVITTPTMRPDGSLLTKAGYDAETRLLLVAPPALPAMPSDPTKKDAETALAKLEELITEFPFVDETAKAVALSAIITPVARAAFNTTPLHIMRAPTPGSGKSYLLDIASAIASGFPMPVIAAGRTEEETEKRLGAALMAGHPLISIDNLNGELSGDALAQIIERPIVEVRILGKSELVRIEARGTSTFATGNNITVVGDLCRRVLIATLDPEIERPELRKFKANPVETVLANRGGYIAACLTICRAYLLAGRPNKANPLASFGGWSDCVRSALIWLGKADPVASMELAREEDPERTKLRDLLQAWHAHFVDVPKKGAPQRAVQPLPPPRKPLNQPSKKVPDLIPDQKNEARRPLKITLARVIEDYNATGDFAGARDPEHPELYAAVDAIAGWRGPADVHKLGNWLKRRKGRVVDGLRLMQQANPKGGSLWWVEAVD